MTALLKGNIEKRAATAWTFYIVEVAFSRLSSKFTEVEAKRILDSPPDNQMDGDTLRTVLKDAMIRFTHFVKMVDDDGPTSDLAYAAFIRCMAVICLSDEATIDCMIPVLLRDELLCESVMSGILIQFKTKGSKPKYPINRASMEFFAPTENEDSRFYMTWVLELGLKPSPTKLAYIPAKVRDKKKGKTKEVMSSAPGSSTAAPLSKINIPSGPTGGTRARRSSHARYSLSVYGCTSDVYKGVFSWQADTYAGLVQDQDLLAEHPRQDSNSHALVRRQKPFWITGSDSYHWLENDMLNGENDECDDESGDFFAVSLFIDFPNWLFQIEDSTDDDDDDDDVSTDS